MKYPALTIDVAKFKENLEKIRDVADATGINICAVTKCFCALPKLTKLYWEAGFRDFADSRLENLNKILYPDANKWLLRLPMISEARETVLHADISLNSEIETIRTLGAEAVKLGKKHSVIIMVELGDLREGVLPKEVIILAGEVLKVDGIRLLGIGANFNCYGGIIPTPQKLSELIHIVEEIEQTYDITLQIVSGGNSGSVYLLKDNNLPKRINNLRLGEVIFIGKETSFQENLWGLHTDIFTLCTEIVELKEKPSMPYGKRGLNAFGKEMQYANQGLMKRAIVACGRQDISIDEIEPRDMLIKIIGSSSDHIIIDVTHTNKNYSVGDIIEFNISYGALLSLCTSEYVEKVYV